MEKIATDCNSVIFAWNGIHYQIARYVYFPLSMGFAGKLYTLWNLKDKKLYHFCSLTFFADSVRGSQYSSYVKR